MLYHPSLVYSIKIGMYVDITLENQFYMDKIEKRSSLQPEKKVDLNWTLNPMNFQFVLDLDSDISFLKRLDHVTHLGRLLKSDFNMHLRTTEMYLGRATEAWIFHNTATLQFKLQTASETIHVLTRAHRYVCLHSLQISHFV